MPVITLQLGQCGNQLGASLFEQLGAEYCTQQGGGYGVHAHEAFFKQQEPARFAKQHNGGKPWVARAVLIDMEPKVVNAAMQQAQVQASSCWSYGNCGVLCQQSGAGNNWAQGYYKYGNQVKDQALELVRREAEACDMLEGCLLLQSMAGGTGAGLGTCIAEAVRDNIQSSHLVNCCIWPHESGEVSVQPFNTLLTLSHLAEVTDGIMLLQNDVLHATCTKLHSIKRPGFQDMNAVAARAIASAMLPCHERSAAEDAAQDCMSSRISTKPSSSHAKQLSAAVVNLRLSQADKGIQQQVSPPHQVAPAARLLHPLADLAHHLCAHPRFKLFTARSVPQMAAQSVEFTTFTWQGILRRLRQMAATGSVLEEGMDWGSGHAIRCKNRSVSSMLILRGQASAEVDVEAFQDAGLYPSWAVKPMLVASHPAQYGKCEMSATLLANDQTCVRPVRRMQDNAYALLGAGAFVHQYQRHGMDLDDFKGCFAAVEDMLASYGAL